MQSPLYWCLHHIDEMTSIMSETVSSVTTFNYCHYQFQHFCPYLPFWLVGHHCGQQRSVATTSPPSQSRIGWLFWVAGYDEPPLKQNKECMSKNACISSASLSCMHSAAGRVLDSYQHYWRRAAATPVMQCSQHIKHHFKNFNRYLN